MTLAAASNAMRNHLFQVRDAPSYLHGIYERALDNFDACYAYLGVADRLSTSHFTLGTRRRGRGPQSSGYY